MYTAHDGKNFGNTEMGRHYDKTRAGAKDDEEKKGGEGNEADDGGGDGEETPMHEVVAEHGTAHTSHIQEENDGHHSVKTTHEDGHKHTSHKNADGEPHDIHSAHAHSMHAMTGEEQDGGGMEHEEPDGDEGEMAAPMIPGMRG